MRIGLACAGRRGLRFLGRLAELAEGAELVVFSFREEPHEPPFLDDIRDLTVSRGGRFVETRRVDGPKGRRVWDEAPPDLLLVVGWRYLIPADAYRRPRLGTFVIHDSLLPKYRGFSPTVWAIRNGEAETGATLFAIADEVDAGDVVDQEAVPIGPEETIAEVAGRVTEAYLRLLDRNLAGLTAGTAPRRPQDHSRMTYVPRRTAEDSRLDWRAGAASNYNLIRAVTAPYPGAFTTAGGRRLRVWGAARPTGGPTAAPGRVLELWPGQGAVVAAADGPLLLREVQWDEGGRGCASVLLRGVPALGD